jgi:dipeptidyl-peptidase 4
MIERYGRAVRLTAPKLATESQDGIVDGYWLDESHYFFRTERLEPSSGRMVTTPMIAACAADHVSVDAAIPLGRLAKILCEQREQPELSDLSAAAFDMPDLHTLAVSLGSRDYLVDVRRGSVLWARTAADAPALYSPDRRYACVVDGYNVRLKTLDSGAERLLTTDGISHCCYGREPETGLSAVSHRAAPNPVGLWSPDSRWFLTHRIDERSVPDLALVENAPSDGGRPVLHRYRYAMPGDPLPIARYVAIHVTSGRRIALDEFPVTIAAFSPFSMRTVWFGEGDTVWFVRFDRYCKGVELIAFDLAQALGRVVLSESVASGYIELNHLINGTPNVRVLSSSGEVIWFSERDGWGHLYRYDGETGQLINRVTQGDWSVRDIVSVDERGGKIWFTASGVDPQVDPARRSLCAVHLDGSGFEVALVHDGDVCVPKTEPGGLGWGRLFQPSYAHPGISPGGNFAVIQYRSVNRGNRTEIVDLAARRSHPLAASSSVPQENAPCPFVALAADGITPLHGVMFRPPDFDASRRYALIDYIYPGPQITQQPQSFRSLKSAQCMALAELGFITFMLDTRGMPFRSRNLHQVGYGELLEPQLADHAAVVSQLSGRHSYIDGTRVGILGYSGGGAATARAMCDYGSIFKVGVAVCGNHDASLYAAIWSDKYRGPPDPHNWASQANATVAHKLEGKLLLISGDMDENVHVSQTLSLVAALIRANRDFDLLIVPREGHLLLHTNAYVQRRVWDYFTRHLLGQEPPPNFEMTFESREIVRMKERSARESQ